MRTGMSSAFTTRITRKGSRRALVGAASSVLIAGSAMVALAPSASAINGVTCGTRTDFAKAAGQSSGPRCWANAGTVVVNVPGVLQLCSGNNVVTWTYHWSMGNSTLTQARNRCESFSNITVLQVKIA